MLAPRTLWREILSDRRLTSRPKLTILEHARQAHDRAKSPAQQILTAGELIETQTGGIKANPLLWSSYKPERCARGSSTSSFRMKASAVPAGMLSPYKPTPSLDDDDEEGEQLIDDLDRPFFAAYRAPRGPIERQASIVVRRAAVADVLRRFHDLFEFDN
jgi:hypothetical protein